MPAEFPIDLPMLGLTPSQTMRWTPLSHWISIATTAIGSSANLLKGTNCVTKTMWVLAWIPNNLLTTHTRRQSSLVGDFFNKWGCEPPTMWGYGFGVWIALETSWGVCDDREAWLIVFIACLPNHDCVAHSFSRYRHYNLTIFLSNQTIKTLPTVCRSMATALFLSSCYSTVEREKVLDEWVEFYGGQDK